MQNKLVREKRWREMGRKGEREEQGGSRPHDSLIGQLFWYLLAAQLRRLQVVRHTEKAVTPILGYTLRISMYVKNGVTQ